MSTRLHLSVASPNVPAMQQLTDDEKAVLDFETQQWTHPGAKETAIVRRFGVLAPAYYARLNWLIDRPEALTYEPLLVRRLQRLRDARVAARAAR